MTQLPESPIITIERRKAVTIIISALLVAVALGGGLMKVGSGFAARSANGITVTGSAKVAAVADNAVWTLSVALSAPRVSDAVTKIGVGVDALTKYLTDGGLPIDAITLGSVSTYSIEEVINGNSTGRILSYRGSRGIGSILQNGVPVNNYGPQYYVSTLADLRPQLLSEAMKDAKVRADALTKAVGGSVGNVSSVKSGPFQVTTPDSTMTSDMGAYDTSSINKTITATVSVTFDTK